MARAIKVDVTGIQLKDANGNIVAEGGKDSIDNSAIDITAFPVKEEQTDKLIGPMPKSDDVEVKDVEIVEEAISKPQPPEQPKLTPEQAKFQLEAQMYSHKKMISAAMKAVRDNFMWYKTQWLDEMIPLHVRQLQTFITDVAKEHTTDKENPMFASIDPIPRQVLSEIDEVDSVILPRIITIHSSLPHLDKDTNKYVSKADKNGIKMIELDTKVEIAGIYEGFPGVVGNSTKFMFVGNPQQFLSKVVGLKLQHYSKRNKARIRKIANKRLRSKHRR